MEHWRVFRLTSLLLALFMTTGLWFTLLNPAQEKQVVWSAEEKPLAEQIRSLRSLADDVRAGTTRDLALKIRKLPATNNKLRLALGLAELSTEGDFGHDTLQEVATTLADTLRERPVAWQEETSGKGVSAGSADSGVHATRKPADEYFELATLVRYERVEASLDDPQFAAAMTLLEHKTRSASIRNSR